ncbi:uncharacterized protein LOC133804161 [Humulus lupulus]|uniref:uncharacterized protein LOC133804161 n=1 Tax=Humulus lupulus TaxID=3486 RepID=UPI002B41582D|nr:uncharacterized protein LOC133804161 [Humulus lupulus]
MPEFPNCLRIIFDLLASVGYTGDENSDKSASEKLCGGLSWCVAALNSDPPQNHDGFGETRTQDDIVFEIAEALRLMKCPHPIEACQIENLDCQTIISVVHWLVDRVRTTRGDRKDENQGKFDVLNQLQRLRERIAKQGAETKVQMLVSLVHSQKELERKEIEFQMYCNARLSHLQTDVVELNEKVESGYDSQTLSDGLNRLLSESAEELISARKELAALLRTILAVRRQLDSVPSQSELIQYERRFSELYAHIQGKHQQTQKYYDTYNTLLEIKELMLKETSLLNSLSSQFQVAISSTMGRMKLIDSMEGIVKGSRQKLEKLQLGLEEQQQVCDALKESYTAEITAERQWFFLLKIFQEECLKNERLRRKHI